jgi:hypothetical protein
MNVGNDIARRFIGPVGVAARLGIVFILIVTGCLDPYPPPVTDAEVNFLVVDGFINSGTGEATVKLSRALPIDASEAHPPVRRAQVRVEKDDGTAIFLTENTPGNYTTVRNDLHIGSSYKLIIQADGKEYESDFVKLKQSPVLEDLSWTQEGDGITVHVDSRDPAATTRYYQWVYTETWEYDADKESGYYARNGFAIPRQKSESIHICYSSVASSKVLIGTTQDQSGDFINDFPLVHITAGSKKLSRHYSILVQQRALDEDSYNYWLQLQRTTENLGGLFDPLPTQVTGNIHSKSDDKEVVLGYFSGGGVEERRLYINHQDLPDDLKFVKRRFCPVDSVNVQFLENYLDGDPLIGPYGTPVIIGYTVSTKACLDCRTEGGTLTKPSFWPY